MEEKIAYLCDRKRHCNSSRFCSSHCRHTFDEFHAKHGINSFHNKEKKFKKINTENGIMFIEEE